MFLSDRTMKLLMESGIPSERLVEIFRALWEDEEAARPMQASGAARTARYRARLEATGLTTLQWRELSARIISRDGGRCRYCGTGKGRMHCDHVNPLVQGGDSSEGNLVCACAACNREKSGRTLEEWKGAAWAAEWRAAMSRDVTVHAEADNPPPPAFPPEPPQPPTPTRECVTSRGEREREEAGFAKFWQAYPRKTAKADARKAFAKAWKKLPPFDEELILSGGLERAKAAWSDAQFIPHAATWLNGERWQDEATVIPMKPAHEQPHHDQRQAARADRLGRSLAGLMAAVDEREPVMGRGGADAGGRS